MRRAQLVRNPQPMHPPVNGLLRLQEGFLQIGHVVFKAVVVGNFSRRVLTTGVTNVIETSVYQSQHVLRRILVKHPPLTATGQVDWRGVRHNSAAPAIEVGTRLKVSRATAAQSQP